MRVLKGIPASDGMAVGPAVQIKWSEPSFPLHRLLGALDEWRRYADAVEQARGDLSRAHRQASQHLDPDAAALFGAYALMLDDPELIDSVRTSINTEGLSAEAALLKAIETYAQAIEAADSSYLRRRAADVRDIGHRVVAALSGTARPGIAQLSAPAIVLADELTPTTILLADTEILKGFCTTLGGPTSHAAILARSLGIPAVVGADRRILDVPNKTPVILDGTAGRLLVDPDDDTESAYRERYRQAARAVAEKGFQGEYPAVTTDGHRVRVFANADTVASARKALDSGAEGIGLLRTEYVLPRHQVHTADEAAHYEAYRQIAEVLGELPVTLRTLDIGGDKPLPGVDLPAEANPALGQRGIRLSLARPGLFRAQLRAILRLAAEAHVRLMFPLVSSVSEIEEARAILDECRAELVHSGLRVPEKTDVGVTVETPAAALMADKLADHVDFFSIGTNDLAQFTMAADRANPAVSPLASALHPAVLRLVQMVVEAAHEHHKSVGVCGEVASDPAAVPLLVGLGIDELSVSPPAIPLVKAAIRSISLGQARSRAEAALNLEDQDAVLAVSRQISATDGSPA